MMPPNRIQEEEAGLEASVAALEQAPLSWVEPRMTLWVTLSTKGGWHREDRAQNQERSADALAVHDVKEKNKQ